MSLQDDRLAFPPPNSPASFVDDRVRQMAEFGATIIRVDLRWDIVAPTQPADPTNPDDPAYRWEPYDRIAAAAKRSRVKVLFTAWGTPPWAEDPTVPPDPTVLPFAKPVRPKDPALFGQFGQAAAQRFAPKGVHLWEAWNEPNLTIFLRPQYERRGGRWVATSPATYAAMLTSFRDGVRSVDPDARVAGGVLAPAGDKCFLSCPASTRMPRQVPPQSFIAALDAPELRPAMDAFAQHPYPIAGPPAAGAPPRKRVIDIYNLADLEAALDTTYLKDTPLWLTEYGFQTEQVAVQAFHVALEEQAAYISDAFRRLRASRRVEFATYYLLQDNPDWRTGLLDLTGLRKPGLSGFTMPLYAEPATPLAAGDEVTLTGQVRAATGRTNVIVEWKDGDAWKELTVAKTAADGTFSVAVTPRKTIAVRARWSGTARTGNGVEWTSDTVQLAVRSG